MRGATVENIVARPHLWRLDNMSVAINEHGLDRNDRSFFYKTLPGRHRVIIENHLNEVVCIDEVR